VLGRRGSELSLDEHLLTNWLQPLKNCFQLFQIVRRERTFDARSWPNSLVFCKGAVHTFATVSSDSCVYASGTKVLFRVPAHSPDFLLAYPLDTQE
jgi:hypothetical protein